VLAVLMFARGGRARQWALYLIPAAAAVLAKEQGVMAAPLLFMYLALCEYQLSVRALLQPRQVAAVLRETWPAFLVCAAIVVGGLRLATTFAPGGPSRWHYLLTQPFVIVHYVSTFFLPVNLSADTDWTAIANPFDDRVLIGVLFCAFAVGRAAVASRRRETRPVAYGILWFFVALLPTSSLVPLAEVMNDHRVYFPFVGLTLGVAWALGLLLIDRQRLPAAGRWIPTTFVAAAVMVLLAQAYGARQRNEVWRTEESLWLDATRKSPENSRALMNYGLVQMAKGNLAGAEDYFNRALRYSPRYAYLHVNMGVFKGALNQPADAERHFREAQQHDPRDPVTSYHYARWLQSIGRTDEAVTLARRAIELSSAHLDARHLLLDIFGHGRAWPAVQSLARDTLRLDPADSVAIAWLKRSEQRESAAPTSAGAEAGTPEFWLELSLTEYRAGRYQECVESSQRALTLRPDYAEAYNNICAAQHALGRFSEAVAACERALAIRPDLTIARNNLELAKAKLEK
jgi:tetratricopeptide (TPR) repeat protein